MTETQYPVATEARALADTHGAADAYQALVDAETEATIADQVLTKLYAAESKAITRGDESKAIAAIQASIAKATQDLSQARRAAEDAEIALLDLVGKDVLAELRMADTAARPGGDRRAMRSAEAKRRVADLGL